MSALRVLEAITPSRIGGAEVYVADLCRELPALDAEIELFCPAGRPFVEYAKSLDLNPITWKTHGKLDPITIVKLAGLIKRDRIDVTHTHLSTASLLGALAAKLAGIPSVAHVHGLNSAACFKRSSLVIAVSKAVKRHLCAQGLPENRVRVVHNGVDMDKFFPMPIDDVKREQGFDPETPIFGVFGRLSSEKGQRVAIEAFALLLKDAPTARLILTGDGNDRPALEDLVRSLGIEARVRFVGFVPDIRGLIAACDAVIVPSLKEGFGLVAVNAMAMERPVVATTVGGLPEIVLDSETGFLNPPNDPKSIARSLMLLVQDKPLSERMGRQGRIRARECFEIKARIGEVLALLKEAAESNQ
ncbi:MAG: glycosyltransferase family 4 protein [Armatimonadetes bacterium]|nr:glycosyltransferase family 4 protein [Armatimonadota bacterium]